MKNYGDIPYLFLYEGLARKEQGKIKGIQKEILPLA